MRVKRKSVEAQAEENVEVTKKVGREAPETLKKGSHVDHSIKHLEENIIGMSVGTTINMENYESLRVDVWATVSLDGKSVDEAYNGLFEVLDNKLKETVSYYTED